MPKDKDNHPHLTVVSDTGDKLTAKQEHFCQLVANGETLTDAYKAAYNNHISIGLLLNSTDTSSHSDGLLLNPSKSYEITPRSGDSFIVISK